MTILNRMKTAISARNLTRFFVFAQPTDLDDYLNGFINAGIEKVSKLKPITVTASFDLHDETVVELPAEMYWAKSCHLDGRKLFEVVKYPSYPGDRIWESLTLIPMIQTAEIYPDWAETQKYGEWEYDHDLQTIVLTRHETGTLVVDGLGLPDASVLTDTELLNVVKYAMVQCYDDIIAQMVTKSSLKLPGFEMTPHLAELQKEADRIRKEFNDEANHPYGVMVRV